MRFIGGTYQVQYLRFFILFFGGSILQFLCSLRTYEKDYFGEIGLSTNFSYSDMIQIKGELSEIRKDSEGFTYVYYEDLIMVFSDREVPFFVRAEIVGKTYSFGRQKIKVGDTRRKAEAVCRWRRKIKGISDEELGMIEKNGKWEVWGFSLNLIPMIVFPKLY